LELKFSMNKLLMAGIAAVVAGGGAATWFYGPGKGVQGQSVAVAASGATGATAATAPASGALGAAAPAPPVSVTVVRAQQRDFEVQLDASGAVSTLSSVELRPQVSSVIKKVHIREGDFVKAGQLLFTLDVRADEANVTKAKAQLEKDQASLSDAQRQLARSRDLLSQKFVSQGAVDTSQALVDAQTATVLADRAAISAAAVALGYGRIVAPSAGRAGAVNVFAGSSVQANTTPLVTITQLDPVAVSFNLPQRNVGDALAALKAGNVPVMVLLPQQTKPRVGKLQFVDSAVDASSGTVKVKAVFDNKDSALWPGAFVNVKMGVQTIKDAVVVPQAVIVQNARGRAVYVVDAGGKAALRPIELLQSAGLEAVVSGVRAGEKIVLDGRQNVRPGTPLIERAPDAVGVRGGRAGAASGAGSGAASGATAPVEAGSAPRGGVGGGAGGGGGGQSVAPAPAASQAAARP
jgi:RND family efflux transporter MFP subunit